MRRFAIELTRREPHHYFPAEPLRQAMLAARKRRPDPVFWASFASFGFPNMVWSAPE